MRSSHVERWAWLISSQSSAISLNYSDNGRYGPLNAGQTLPGIRPLYGREPLPPLFFVRGSGLPLNDGRAYSVEMQNAPSQRKYREIIFRHRSPRDWVLFIPYWLIILTTALSWVGLLFWRAGRRKRKMRNAELPKAE